MKKAMFHTTYALMLIAALIFGQVGSGFLHNKHDAHEAIIDLDSDRPVLLNHGEHCKVCAVDWVNQFLVHAFEIDFPQQEFVFATSADVDSYSSLSFSLNSSRAPPFLN